MDIGGLVGAVGSYTSTASHSFSLTDLPRLCNSPLKQRAYDPVNVNEATRKLVEATLAAPGSNRFHTSLVHKGSSLLYMLIDCDSLEAHYEFSKKDKILAMISDDMATYASAEVLTGVIE
ncbi:hypothetical protein F5Y13DRAFT_185651 [Hypoxylon sp. FL1857]|nr:hypothetical protein F5Y13DRAFT_185651 [Hypoxylon sp. FL1857]